MLKHNKTGISDRAGRWCARLVLLPLVLVLLPGGIAIDTVVLAQGLQYGASLKTAITREVDAFKKRNRLASLSFSFFGGDGSGFSYAVGYADAGKKIRATPDHIYTIASVTKPITAMTLVDLVQQDDHLSLTDSVHNIIAGFPKNITVLDLLNHTSGFLREKENEHFLTNSSYKRVTDYLPIKFKLKIHRYANFNYAAIGAVIWEVAGRDYSDVASRYFRSITGQPLYFHDQPHPAHDRRFVRNYVRRGRRRILHNPIKFGLWEPAALAQTSAPALAKFLRYHMTPQFIKYIESHAVEIKTRKYRGNETRKECYALGFRLRYVNGELKYIYHNGFLYGVLSTLYYFPKRDMGFVALSNTSSYPRQTLGLGSLYRRVEKAIDQEFNRRMAEYTAKNGFVAGAIFYKTNRHQGELIEKLIEDYAQSYLKKKKYREAINLFKLNNFIFPDSVTTYHNLADAYKKSGDKGRAQEMLLQGAMVEGNGASSMTQEASDAPASFR